MPECISQSIWKLCICCIQFNFFFNLHLSSWLIHGADPLSPSFTAGGRSLSCRTLPWTSWSSRAPSCWACPVLSGWHPIPQPCQPQHQLLVICKLSVGALDPCMPSMMVLNRIGLHMDLWGQYSSLISILPLDFLKLNFLSIYVILIPFQISSLSWLYPRTLISALHVTPGSFFSVK